MSGFYKLKQILETYYREYGTYMEAAARFLIAFVLFLQINGRIGKSSPLGNIFTELILALICAVLPPNAMVLLTALMALAQFAATSILTLAVGGGILILLLLLYLTFARGEAWALLLTMTGLFFHMPCIVPVGFGLVGSPLSAAGIAVGTIFYYDIGGGRYRAGGGAACHGASEHGRNSGFTNAEPAESHFAGAGDDTDAHCIAGGIYNGILCEKNGYEVCVESCDRMWYTDLSGADGCGLSDAETGDWDSVDFSRNGSVCADFHSAGRTLFCIGLPSYRKAAVRR